MKIGFSIKHSAVLLFSAASLFTGTIAHGQTLLIVSGQGQIVANASVANQPLVVQLLDSTGKPFPNQIVTFQDNQSGQYGAVNGTPAPTDANGVTSVQFRGANIPQGNGVPFVQTLVIATYGSISVNFTETTTGVNSGGGGPLVQAQPQLIQGQVITGPAGSTGTPIVVRVGSQYNTQGVPNVAVAITVDPGSGTGTLSCKEGPFVLTDSTGTAVCTPIFGKLGTGSFTIVVGSQFTFSLNQFSVTVGPPGIISVTSGANQSGLPGQTLPLPIVATVQDLAGNTLTGVQVVFESVTPGGATFTNSRTTSDANGRISSSVVLGNVPGPIQIRIRDVGNLVANPPIVTETVNISISNLIKIGGDGQTAFINAQFGQPVSVRVNNAAGQPVQSATVTFTVTSGSATVSPNSVLTAPDGSASATVTAGGVAGPITVTASVAGLTQTFSLTANPPGPTNFSYLNGASFAPNQISPGSIVTIQAQGLVSANVQGVVGGTLVGALPYTVAGVSVTVDNIPAPIFYVGNQNGQQSVTIQIPFEVRATTVPITVAVNGGGSTSAFVTVLPVAPGVFQTTGSDGVSRVVAIRSNGTVVTPQNPAGRGENIRVYLTGLGPVTPSVPTGTFSPFGADPAVTSNLVAGIANNGVTIVQAIYARNLVGVYELTVTVPTDTVAFPSGTVNFSIAVQGPNGYVYSNPSSIAIQ